MTKAESQIKTQELDSPRFVKEPANENLDEPEDIEMKDEKSSSSAIQSSVSEKMEIQIEEAPVDPNIEGDSQEDTLPKQMQDINMQISQAEEKEEFIPEIAKFQSEGLKIESSEEQLVPKEEPDNRVEEEESKLATVQKEVSELMLSMNQGVVEGLNPEILQ